MPVLDGSFEAFVTNLGKYNEGELVGEWVHFPTTEEEMKKVFERIGIGSKDEFGQVYEEWFTPLPRRAMTNNTLTCPAVWMRQYSAGASSTKLCRSITSGLP